MRLVIVLAALVSTWQLCVSKEALVIETLVYIDYTEYVKWVHFKDGNKALALEEMKNFYHYAMKRANDIYQTVDHPKFSLSLSLAGYEVNQINSIFADLPAGYNTREPYAIKMGDALKKMSAFYKESQKDKSGKRTKYDVAVFVANIGMGRLKGVARNNGACTTSPLVLLAYDTSNEFITTLTHEIAHTLGADHDGTSNDCKADDLYNLTPGGGYSEHHLVANNFKFSTCTISYFEKFIIDKSLNEVKDTCFRHTTTNFVPSDVTMPGQMYSLDQQCQLQLGPTSYHCGGGAVCRELFCYQPLKKTCVYQHRKTSSDGTPCGDKMWCYEDACVHDSEAPSLGGDIIEHCHLGDFKGYLREGDEVPFCEKVRSKPSLCYKAFNYNKCCETCKNLDSEVEACRFGDKMEGCSTNMCVTEVEDCCGTCNNGLIFD